MRDQGTWFLVALDKATDIMVAKIRQRLKREGHLIESLPSGPGFFVRARLDNAELSEQIQEAVEYALPRARYDFKARQRRIIRLEFRE
jgi:DNA primase catalytic subunit